MVAAVAAEDLAEAALEAALAADREALVTARAFTDRTTAVHGEAADITAVAPALVA